MKYVCGCCCCCSCFCSFLLIIFGFATLEATEFGLKDGYDARLELITKSMESSIHGSELTSDNELSTIDKYYLVDQAFNMQSFL